MRRFTFLLVMVILLQACSTTSYYVVRHAEKATQAANMSSDVELSTAGKERAIALREKLQNKQVKHIYSTNTLRTKGTAQPLSDAINVAIQTYDHRDTALVSRIKVLPKGNVLIVGHSNTVDDLVNRFYEQAGLKDLPDTQYGDLFIIKKKGNRWSFTTDHFGK